MALFPDLQAARAQAIRARGLALPPEGLPGDDIQDSWVRCLAAGLDSGAAVRVPVLPHAELQQRRAQHEVVRRLARAELETLAPQIAGSNYLLAFADADGVILDLVADNRFAMSGDNAGIVAGSCWREEVCGTNGLGTALATGRPVAVTGLEHYFLKLGEVSCTAAPVRDASGQVVGVLDASSYFEGRQRHTQALVQLSATRIENGLLAHQMRQHWLLALHPHAEFLGTLSAGLLSFDEQGLLRAANAQAQVLLQGLQTRPGIPFETLFGEPFERVRQALQRQGEQRLRDARGAAFVVRCVAQPKQRVGAEASMAAMPRSALAAEASAAAQTSAVESASGFTSARPPADPLSARPTAEPAGPAPHRAPPPQRAARTEAPAANPLPVTEDPAVAEAYRMVHAAVRLGVPILLCGETGSGKEMLAQHAHRSSGRGGAFAAVNCGALPAELIEAELFGYVGGAFSGARREGSIGLIASADGGTLLLDEVGELPLALQASLLRFLDDRQVRPVGGTASRRVDVQLLAATHADLDAEVAARRFRADLLYRLNTVRVTLPPLRARRDFAAAARSTLNALDPAASLDDSALALLAAQPWPGNFRELRGVLTRVLLQRQLDPGAPHPGAAKAGPISAEGLRRVLGGDVVRAADGLSVLGGSKHTDVQGRSLATADGPSALQRTVGDWVRSHHARCGSVSQTARALGISRTTVYRHLRAQA